MPDFDKGPVWQRPTGIEQRVPKDEEISLGSTWREDMRTQ
jgi:hypothetical protein